MNIILVFLKHLETIHQNFQAKESEQDFGFEDR
jgi:hypothetical protein